MQGRRGSDDGDGDGDSEGGSEARDAGTEHGCGGARGDACAASGARTTGPRFFSSSDPLLSFLFSPLFLSFQSRAPRSKSVDSQSYATPLNF